jgi:regulatory protein
MNNISSKKCSTQIICVEHLQKGKYKVCLDSGECYTLYRSEIKSLGLREGDILTEENHEKLLYDMIGKRAKKRALHLLEQMDRTESQLREKLLAAGYPKECIEEAILYLYQYHYLDDLRYARNFIRYRQDKLSRLQLKQKLMAKGISKEHIEIALEEEFSADETSQIATLLEKKHYQGEGKDTAQFRKTYQYLLRRGFLSGDILKEMERIQRIT